MDPLGAIFPGICSLCRRRSHRRIDLCPVCESAFETNDRTCPVCAGPAPAGDASSSAICGACLVNPPPWTLTLAPFTYSPPLRRLIEGLKSGNGLREARVLGNLLIPAIQNAYGNDPLPEALIPLPLARKRQRRRGFNQAELLARVIGRGLDLPRIKGRLVRVRDDPPQRSLPRSARLRNVRGAFAVRTSGRRKSLPRRVALIDDVSTTGATVRAAAEALRRADVEEVHVWVAAKARARP
ncbi:MAG: ComF family protein [Gammaproteobacteria bacterium]|nr:ComF family protein [Gammaproteobacteria bacterium]